MDGYIKLGVVGRGAYGVASLYRKPRDRTGPPMKVIIKTIQMHGYTVEEEEAHKKEARILQSLRHPNIIKCFGYECIRGELHIIMHYAEGGTLHQLITDQQGKFLPDELIMYYFAQLLQALRFIHHKKILHRDIKTQNILLNRKRTIVMLGDFGISKELSNTRGDASTVIGTPNYLSPEICNGLKYNIKSDIWALGCCLYEMVELTRPFEGEFPFVLKNISTGKRRQQKNTSTYAINDLINNLLCVDPDQRPNTDMVISNPCVLRRCIDITLDLGRIENNIEKLVKEIAYKPRGHNFSRSAEAEAATLTIGSNSTLTRSASTLVETSKQASIRTPK